MGGLDWACPAFSQGGEGVHLPVALRDVGLGNVCCRMWGCRGKCELQAKWRGTVLNLSPAGEGGGGAACGAGGRKGRAVVQRWSAGGMGSWFESYAGQVL